MFPIVIIGAGISGLTLARALLRRGIPSTIYERSPLPTDKRRHHDYGITLSADSCVSLAVELRSTIPNFRRRVSVDNAQGHVHPREQVASRPASDHGGQLRAHRGKLESLLATGLDIQWGHDLCSVEPRGTLQPGTKLRFRNGHETTTASLVVGADGVHSALRSLVAPQVKPCVLPYVVFRGQRRVDAGHFRRCGVAMCSSCGGMALCYYLRRRARPDADVLYKPDRKVNEANVIPEEFYQEISGITGLEEPFKSVCDIEMMRQDRIQNFLMRQLVPDGGAFKEWAKLGIVFLGDAAHATPIVGSEGADFAVQDALDLADTLDEYTAGSFTSKMAYVESENIELVRHERPTAMILKFYEATLLAERGPLIG